MRLLFSCGCHWRECIGRDRGRLLPSPRHAGYQPAPQVSPNPVRRRAVRSLAPRQARARAKADRASRRATSTWRSTGGSAAVRHRSSSAIISELSRRGNTADANIAAERGLRHVTTLTLIFAIIAYGVFFATFLYLICFVGDFSFAAKTVDFGPTTPRGLAAIVDRYCADHPVRPAAQRDGPSRFKAVVDALRAAAGRAQRLRARRQPCADHPVHLAGVRSTPWCGTSPAPLLSDHHLGPVLDRLADRAGQHLPDQSFRAVRAAAGVAAFSRPRRRTPQLRAPFFYRWIAHPLYSGFFLAFWATPRMTAGHLLLAVGVSIYMLIAIRYEERDLTDLFGNDYRNYRATVGMLTPRFGRRQG